MQPAPTELARNHTHPLQTRTVTRPEPTIPCVECGGTCHLLTYEPDDGWGEGEIIAYRCADCRERFDLYLDEQSPDQDA